MGRLRAWWPALAWALTWAVGPASAEGVGTAPAPLSPQAQAGRAVMQAAQCTRCHPVTDALAQGRGIAPADREQHCVDCHTWILGTKGDEAAKAKMRVEFPEWDRYLDNIVHFTRLPDLGTLLRRVRPAFVRGFLDRSEDLRPHLDERMIPLRLTAAQKDAVVAYLAELAAVPGAPPAAAPSPAPVSPAQIAAGQARFVALGCVTCHLTGATVLRPGLNAAYWQAMRPVAALAPDLRHVRRRIDRATLVRFVQDPQAVDPQSAMPKQAVTAADAEQLADFLLHAELAAPTPPPARDFPVLARPVTWDEVYDEVLGRICVHCHMHPDSNAGDGGAGNTGGLGFKGLGLNLETYAGVQAGLVRDGRRESVIAPPAPGQPPLLYAALARRHTEIAAGGVAPNAARLGMPLGLPPLSEAQMRLMRTWLAQGAPGPTAPAP